MASGKPRIYFDADVFLAYFSAEKGRVDIIDELLAKSKSGQIEIVTSTISITECAFAATEKSGGALDATIEAAMDQMWNDRDVVRMIEVSELVNRRARDLIRLGVPKGWRLKPMDALHLASAWLYEVDELYTYNQSDFKKYEAATGLKIAEPYLVQGTLGLGPTSG
jgi:predicted nucleic acid-binding protein